MRTTALFSALSVAILAMVAYRFSLSDICGWYSKDGSPQIDVIDDRKAACQLSGNVPHCSCSYAAVENMNLNSMRSILSELVQTPFFRYFKTDLLCECPFWPDDGMCSLKVGVEFSGATSVLSQATTSGDCSVCECDPKELPTTWASGETMDMIEQQSCDDVRHESDVDRSIQEDIKGHLEEAYRNPWMPEEKQQGDKNVEYTYVNLLRNPERYTGYKGDHANRIWKTIYEQKCIADVNGAGGGDRPTADSASGIFYRIISGIHSSISAHIVKDYLIDEATRTWGPNLAMFQERLGNPDVKDRVENLYFAYLFVLRAVIKAGPVLKGVHYDTGYDKEDFHTSRLIQMLVDNEELKNSCPVPFDEAVMWKTTADLHSPQSFKNQKLERQGCFRNMTRVMDCVGCEKCKMWGKLQFLGVATSLKILSDGDLSLDRNEVIALINLLERLSASVETVRSLSLRLVDAGGDGMGAISGLVGDTSPFESKAMTYGRSYGGR